MKPDIREMTLKRGIKYATDVELLMLILGSGNKTTSVEKLAETVNARLCSCDDERIVESLVSIKGVGESKALAIAASCELGRRRNLHKGAVIKSPSDIIPFVKSYSLLQKEHFLCISLNGANEIIHIKNVSVGTLNSAVVHPRETFYDAVKENAAAVIVAHNHPSGNCTPSPQDIETTKTLFISSQIIGIELLDHIIFDTTGYFSFLENNLIFGKNPKEKM